MTSRERLKRKAVEDVLDAEAAFKNADATTGRHRGIYKRVLPSH